MDNLTVKVCMLGGTNVGKTCIAVRFSEDVFDNETEATIGAAYLQKDLKTNDGSLYHLHIWDTAGQERFHTLAPLYYRGASVIIVVYDITRCNSFNQDLRKWINEVNEKCDMNNVILVIVGNKVDLEEQREVEKSAAQEYAERQGAFYWETSAKTGQNIEEMFENICFSIDKSDKIRSKLAPSVSIKSGRLTVRSHSGKQVKEAPKKKSCCN